MQVTEQNALTMTELLIFASSTVGLLCIYFAMYDYITKNVIENEMDFPPDARESMMIFKITGNKHPCQLSAKGVFSMLTNIDLGVLEYLSGSVHHDFDPDTLAKKVTYLAYIWTDDKPLPHVRCMTHLTHVVVHYDGYLYQSYRCDRNRWSSWMDAYPMIKMPLTDEHSQIFDAHPEKLTVKLFNRLCAPTSHPLEEDVSLRCIHRYAAVLNPTRRHTVYDV